jgi:hypothetical protein
MKMLRKSNSDATDLMDLDRGVLKGLCIRPPEEVDKPTYGIVGPVQRVDSRDHSYSRIALRHGTPPYEDYYSRHPEKKEVDDEMRKRGKESGRERLEKNRIDEEMGNSSFYGAVAISGCQ